MKGLVAYVMPKVLKVVGGVVVGVFVFTAFKGVYTKYFPMLQNSLTDFDMVVSAGMQSGVSNETLAGFMWFDVFNFFLPIVETFNVFAVFMPTITTVYLVRFVFRILDVWINGVTALVSGGQ